MSAIDKTTAADTGHPDLFNARTILTRIKDLNQLMFMAGEGLVSSDRKSANAITAGADVIEDLLNKVCEIIDDIDNGRVS